MSSVRPISTPGRPPHAVWTPLAALALLLLGAAPAASAALDKAAIERMRAATYEVVVPKPVKDALTYERPLPLDLIPYAIRKDKYYSIGTAFAIDPERFVSAAHVLGLDADSQYREIFLRDRHGAVYPVDRVIKYSHRHDFVVFTLKGKKAEGVLETHTEPRLNERVYAVGNALGEGIVIRDGLYTSDTPEEREGAWRWIRFSAAASPGNSGGPLLDAHGRVIGIVLRKSENENLNYALPIAEVIKAPDNLAVLDVRLLYFLDNMDMTRTDVLKKDIPLPLPYAALRRELATSIHRFSEQMLKDLLTEHADNIFPRGSGSATLLHTVYSASFPRLIAKGGDGNWDAYAPKETKEADLGKNGYLSYGVLGNSLFLRLRKPDDVALERLYADSKLFMDLILKGLNIPRRIGMERIKIVSMGPAHEEYVHTDGYGRKWQVRSWLLEFSDEKLVTFTLPAPGGGVAILRVAPTAKLDGHILDLKALADFVYVSYYGSLAQWREFLAMREWLPPAVADIRLTLDYGRTLRYESKRLSFSYGPELMKVDPDSDLRLDFAYFEEGRSVVWDAARVMVGEDKNTGTAFFVTRHQRPPSKLSDRHRSDWESIISQRHPYNRTPFFKDKHTMIGAAHTGERSPQGHRAAPLVYTVMYGVEGSVEPDRVKGQLERFLQGLTVHEYR